MQSIHDKMIRELACCGRLSQRYGKHLAALYFFKNINKLDPYNVEWLCELGQCYYNVSNFKAASKVFQIAMKIDVKRIIYWEVFVTSLVKQKKWKIVIAVCIKAKNFSNLDQNILYSLGQSYYMLACYSEAKIFYREALELDGNYIAEKEVLLANNLARFESRSYMLDFINKEYKNISSTFQNLNVKIEKYKKKIYMYWGQGFEMAPPIVRSCYNKMKMLHGDDLVELNDNNLENYVNIPDFIKFNENISMAHKSDIIRMLILTYHGGIWADATCYPSQNLLVHYSENFKDGFFAFRSNESMISNWFLCSEKGGYISKMILSSLLVYWKCHDKANDYFFFHHIFESLLLVDREFERSWLRVKRKYRSSSLKMARKLGDKYDKNNFLNVYESSAVHKLTHKYKKKYSEQEFGKDSLLNYLIGDEL